MLPMPNAAHAGGVHRLITVDRVFIDSSFENSATLVTIERQMRQAFDLFGRSESMQATRDVSPNGQPSPLLDPKASPLPEYVYRIGILIAVILLLWTIA
jgi:hypothetical protein